MAELMFQNKKVYYEVHGSKGEPIVLLNGIMMSTASWKPFLETMTMHNRLILLDFFDQGQSQRMTEGYTQSIQVELLEAVLKEMAVRMEQESFTLMGISYGGEVAVQYVLAYPERVKRLVLANTCGRTSSWLKKIGDGWNEVAGTDNGYAYYLTTIPVIYSTGFFDYLDTNCVILIEWSENVENALPENTLKITINRGEGDFNREEFLTTHFGKKEVREALIRLTNSAASYNVVDRLHEIQCPTLVISSSEDVLVPPTEQQLLHRHIKGSTYVTINGSGHASMYEAPEAFAALTLGFANLSDKRVVI